MPSARLKHRIGQLLLNNRSITQRQLREALVYQQSHDCRIGEALIATGAIDEPLLRKVLRRQRWLRPCATCFALLSPFSYTYAIDPEQNQAVNYYANQTDQWDLLHQWQSYSEDSPQVSRILSTALDVYMGAPEKGEWRYAVSRTAANDDEGYQVEVRWFF